MGLIKTSICVGVGVLSACFVGYIIYFDHKRCKDPDYKKKVHKRRQRERELAEAENLSAPKSPDMMQRYFVQQIQLGELQLSQGDFENGTQHLANAIAVCGQPGHLMQILQSAMPPEVFSMLVHKVQEIRQRPDARLSFAADELGSL